VESESSNQKSKKRKNHNAEPNINVRNMRHNRKKSLMLGAWFIGSLSCIEKAARQRERERQGTCREDETSFMTQ
jgi:hypothetical protein